MSSKRKKIRHPHLFPREHLEKLAYKLCNTTISEEIAFNTLRDVYRVAYTSGYTRRQEETVRFRKLQEKHIDEGFKVFKDEIDDLIHNKPKIA